MSERDDLNGIGLRNRTKDQPEVRRRLWLSFGLKFRAVVALEPMLKARPELLALDKCSLNGSGDGTNGRGKRRIVGIGQA